MVPSSVCNHFFDYGIILFKTGIFLNISIITRQIIQTINGNPNKWNNESGLICRKWVTIWMINSWTTYTPSEAPESRFNHKPILGFGYHVIGKWCWKNNQIPNGKIKPPIEKMLYTSRAVSPCLIERKMVNKNINNTLKQDRPYIIRRCLSDVLKLCRYQPTKKIPIPILNAKGIFDTSWLNGRCIKLYP